MRKHMLIALLAAFMLSASLVSAASADSVAEYIVKPGDTLSRIARMYNTTPTAIAVANGISSHINFIVPGEVLVIPIAHPHVLIDHPTNGQLLTSPIHVTGRSDTFEAVVSLRALDRNFHVVGTGRAMGGANGTYGNFAADVPFSIAGGQVGYVEAFEVSARDGSQTQVDTVIVVLSASGTTRVTNYTVRLGDTLFGIARRFGTTVSKLAAANGLSNPNLIFAGQVLVIVR